MIPWVPVAAFLLIYVLKHRRELPPLPRAAEATTAFVLLYAITGSLLSLVAAYSHLLASGLAALALFLPVGSEPDRKRSLQGSQSWVLAGIALILLPFLAQRSDFLRLGADAGVYTNSAKNLVATGGTRFEPWVVSGLEEGWDAYPRIEADGLFESEGTDGGFYYQFLPGWPVVLALGARLFGADNSTFIMPVLAFLVAYWIFEVLREWLDGWRLLAGTLCLTLNPLFVYFSRYPTSELFLLLASCFFVAIHVRGYRRRYVLGSIAVAAVAVTHISMFLYLPLLVLYALAAAREGNRTSFRHAAILALLFIAHFVAAYFFSPQYYRDTYSKFMTFTTDLPFWAYPLGLALSLIILLPLLHFGRRRLVHFDHSRLILLFPVWLALLIVYSVYTGYQFGYTSNPVSLLTGQPFRIAGTARELFVDRGLFSLVHLIGVNLGLGTSVIFLLAFLLIVLGRYRSVVEDRVDLFLLSAVLFPFTAYALILPDFRMNYFQSRYLLPVVVPCLIILVLKRASRWSMALFWTVASVSLGWNLFYSSFIARIPERPGRGRLVQDLRDRVPSGRPVLAVGNAWKVHVLFAPIVNYDLRSPYAYLGGRCEGGIRRLLRYIDSVKPGELYVLSEHDLPLAGAEPLQEDLVVVNNLYEYWSGILYPYRYTPANETYVLYELRRPGGLLEVGRSLSAQQIELLSPCSYWAEPGGWSKGHFSIRLLHPISGVARLSLETGGDLERTLRAHTGQSGEVTVIIDGVELRQNVSETTVFEFPHPLVVSELEIHSSTLVPVELGINTDRRRLGLDLRRIVFE